MKAFLRSRPVQHLMAILIAGWLKLCRDTLRWTVEGEAQAQAVWDSDSGAIFCVWHATGPLGPACWPHPASTTWCRRASPTASLSMPCT